MPGLNIPLQNAENGPSQKETIALAKKIANDFNSQKITEQKNGGMSLSVEYHSEQVGGRYSQTLYNFVIYCNGQDKVCQKLNQQNIAIVGEKLTLQKLNEKVSEKIKTIEEQFKKNENIEDSWDNFE